MKYLKSYKIFEREMPDEWFEKNPTNYLVANKHKPAKSKMTQSDKVVREWLSEIDWKDIIVTKDTDDDTKYVCTYRNKDYFMHDKRLMEFIILDKYFNRIHVAFGGFLDATLRDMGLGYKCYKAAISKVGWARSSEAGTNENSRRIWKNLIKDPDFYAFEVESKENAYGRIDMFPGFIVFKKTMNSKEIKDILKSFTKEGNKIISSDKNFK